MDSLHAVTRRTFGGFRDVEHLVVVAFFTAANEAFGVAFQSIPAFADLGGFFRANRVVERGFRDLLEKRGELANDFVGSGQHFEALFAGAFWVSDEITTTALAKPLDDSRVTAEFDDLEKSVEGIAASATIFALVLRPLVDK